MSFSFRFDPLLQRAADRTATAAFRFIVDTKRSDVKAFMVHTFGLAKAKELEKAEK